MGSIDGLGELYGRGIRASTASRERLETHGSFGSVARLWRSAAAVNGPGRNRTRDLVINSPGMRAANKRRQTELRCNCRQRTAAGCSVRGRACTRPVHALRRLYGQPTHHVGSRPGRAQDRDGAFDAKCTASCRVALSRWERRPPSGGGGCDYGPCGREPQAGPPGDGEEKNRGTGEHPECADGDGDVERLGGSDSRGEQGGRVGADLRCGAGWADRECCGRRACAEEEERERERVADAERAQQQVERGRPDDPASGDERPCLRGRPERSRARAQPSRNPETRGGPASDQAW